MPSDALQLGNDDLEITLAPAQGASTLAFRARLPGGWTALMPDTRTPGAELRAASFVMAPYSNRIAHGTFPFGGRSIQLANAENHAIHGEVRKRTWQTVALSATRADLLFTSAEHPDLSWPWAFDLAMRVEIRGARVSTSLTLTNRSDTAMPAGFGLHPYFLRAPTTPGEPVLLQFVTRGIYPDAHGTRIPSGPLEPVDPARDFSQEKALDPDAAFDYCAAGFDGIARIAWPRSGAALRLEASPELGHLVLFNPPKPWFALEPVSHANDGVNLLARGEPGSGVRILAPAESMTASLAVTLERA